MIRFMTNSHVDLFRTAESQLPDRKGRTKQEAIDSVMFRMEKGVQVPAVWGKGKYMEYAPLNIDVHSLEGQDDLLSLSQMLCEAEYDNNPHISCKFPGNAADLECYNDCVQFMNPDGGWVQFLLTKDSLSSHV